MPIYMTQFSYTPEALAGMIARPQDRAAAVRKHLKQVGGKLISFYFSFGEYDGLAIYEAPDATAAFSNQAAVVSTGYVKASKTTVLLSLKEGRDAFKKASSEQIQGP